jgi:hypothetical protein
MPDAVKYALRYALCPMAVLPREVGFHTNFIDIKAFIDPI